MDQILHIVKYKLISFVKINTSLKVLNIFKNLGSYAVYALFGVGIYFFTKSSLSYLIEDIKIGTFLLHRFISIVLFIFFMAVNAGNIIVSFSTLYKSNEVFYLVTKPVAFLKIFLIKFLDNFFYSSTTMLLTITTVILGYVVYFEMDYLYLLFFFFFMLLPFMLMAASLGVILLMLIIHSAQKFGLKKVVSGIILVYIVSLILFFKFSHPIFLVEQVMVYYPNINDYFGSLDNPILKFLPNFWISDALYWFSAGKPLNSLGYVLLNMGTSAALFVGAIFTAKKFYYRTWIEASELKLKRVKNSNRQISTKKINGKSIFNPQVDVLLKKEFLQFFREPGQWIHLTVILFLIAIFMVSLSGIDANLLHANNYSLRAIIYITIFLFNLFLISSLSLRFAFPALSLEGDAYWKLKSSPISMKKYMIVKFLTIFLIIFFLGQGLNYFTHISFSRELYLSASINTGFITLATVSFNFGMGSFFINLKEKSPIRLASSQAASITFLFTIVLIIIMVALLFVPIYNYFNDFFTFQDRLKNIYLNSLMISILSITISIIAISLSKKSITRDI